ncbi:relaxase/mobilization nuclease RlxS [Sphingosinicella microcystinivorans]|uniref:Conjugal transfer protein TraI n=1 Tax=Sphingosinicella microcystinivorans TaxID=335406 RepID=A0AAD1G014_SPHMI|nr:relaxase/mobilization nuclease RlxS [Sphingosinicella microcystinivorans]RKS85029.1 type IV secretory pathway VirD2 relaxase [Sphingosinicella microcystinivorans]BBE33313.1 conjugal transfer protein TraI [Sphingosinicella microcystinivorans]
MAGGDDFELWLGRIGAPPMRTRLAKAAARAGRTARRGRSGSKFTGARIGRGGGVASVLRTRGTSHRRVVVKARIVKLGKGLSAARAHVRYLERDGTTREGERGRLYGADVDGVSGKAFLERSEGDRHQFRFIVAPEDGDTYEDLKPLVRRLMTDMEEDLGTKLDWVAVDHFNTGHPHSHVILRGKDERGHDLIIARDYITHGIRARAEAIVSLDLGPRTEQEIVAAAAREVDAERYTGLDRKLEHAKGDDGLVHPGHRDGTEQALRTRRLHKLARLGLAEEVRPGWWKLDPDMESSLRRMGEKGDIIRTMQRQLTAHALARSPAEQRIHDPKAMETILGKVVARGLSDEHADRQYLIVDGIGGEVHYVDIGQASTETGHGSIVRIAPTPHGVRDADRTIAEVAAASGGRYNIDLHLKHDARATEDFAEAHVRRLEAMRRKTGGVTREPDGTWIIAEDHLSRAQDYEAALARDRPVSIEVLSAKPLDQLPGHDGETWLDRELASRTPEALRRGFGAEVRAALRQRMLWLEREGLGHVEADTFTMKPGALTALRQRELGRVAVQLSSELGLAHKPARTGEHIEGRVARSVMVGDHKYSIIEKSREFALVPWRTVLERGIGKQVSGIVRESGISWTIGRSRGLSIGM